MRGESRGQIVDQSQPERTTSPSYCQHDTVQQPMGGESTGQFVDQSQLREDDFSSHTSDRLLAYKRKIEEEERVNFHRNKL